MEKLGRNLIQIEFHQLQMPLATSRVINGRAIRGLAESLEKFGQINPGLAIEDGENLILLDGYLRALALQKCGMDTIWVEVVTGDMATGLLMVLAKNQGRQWEPLEEAQLIQELIEVHGKTQQEVAVSLGKGPSWVSRRLGLLKALPEEVLEAVKTGVIGPWTANRIMAPLARANPGHASRLLEALKKQDWSSRELGLFLKHYEASTKPVRERMIERPDLFFKTLVFNKEKADAAKLRGGPEEDWLAEVKDLERRIKRLQAKTDLLTLADTFNDRDDLVKALARADSLWRELTNHVERSCGDIRRETNSDSGNACSEDLVSRDQQNIECGTRDSSTCCGQGREDRNQEAENSGPGLGPDTPTVQKVQRQRHTDTGGFGAGGRPSSRLQHTDTCGARGSPEKNQTQSG